MLKIIPIKVISFFANIMLRYILFTSKVIIHGEDNIKEVYIKKLPMLMCVWHGRLLFPCIWCKKKKISNMILGVCKSIVKQKKTSVSQKKMKKLLKRKIGKKLPVHSTNKREKQLLHSTALLLPNNSNLRPAPPNILKGSGQSVLSTLF